MITMNNEKFEGKEFAIQVTAKGAFVDNGVGNGKSYVVETIALRLNHVALNEWIFSSFLNCRDCYETEQEWQTYKSEKEAKRKAFNEKIIKDLGIDTDEGSVCITQAQSEVFTVVHIWEIRAEPKMDAE